ncbi:MAG: TIM barrel protein, partial [Verrucomicrobia bacterium]|nr:TIM barrel protein [Verrucomicrobiota bacterium]
IRLARKAGFAYVEFWRWSNKDIEAIEAALKETGVAIAGFVAEPMIPLTDPACHTEFLEGLKHSVDVAHRLATPVLIAQAGNQLADRSRSEQSTAIVDCLGRAAAILTGSGIRLGLEPLNTIVDHPGYFLNSTAEALDIVDEVGMPEIRIVYDIYHSEVMSESIVNVLAGRVDRIAHVHLADAPGRHEPGSGQIDWQRCIRWLQSSGYNGPVGLEYRPTDSTSESLRALMNASD